MCSMRRCRAGSERMCSFAPFAIICIVVSVDYHIYVETTNSHPLCAQHYITVFKYCNQKTVIAVSLCDVKHCPGTAEGIKK